MQCINTCWNAFASLTIGLMIWSTTTDHLGENDQYWDWCNKKNTINTALYAAYTAYTVDTVYTVDMVYNANMV